MQTHVAAYIVSPDRLRRIEHTENATGLTQGRRAPALLSIIIPLTR